MSLLFIRNRWLVVALVFGVGPMIVYSALLHPSILRISQYRERVQSETKSAASVEFGPAPATDRELEELEEVKQFELTKIKEIGSRESLVEFSGALADALAFEARSCGMRIIEVGIQNASIQGKYVPDSGNAMRVLTGFPSPQWNELAIPLDLPMLNLPAIDIEMTVAGEYSQVFSFIELLPEFPALVNLSGLNMIEHSSERAFQLKIRGYYNSGQKREQLAQLENAARR